MVQPEVVAKATAILGLQVFSLKIYNLSWGKRCHNPWFKQRSRWKNSRATIFHTEMVKMITWGHAQGPTKRGFRLKTRDQKWGEMRSKYSCLLLRVYYMKYSVFFGKSWIVSQQTESGRICFFQIKGKCTLFGGPRKFMRYRWIITLGMQMKALIGIPYDYKRCPTRGKLTMASWESFASQHLYLFHFLVDTRGCRFGPEKIQPPDSPIFRSIGYHLCRLCFRKCTGDWSPTRKQKIPPKPNRLESEKHMSESTVMERHRLPGPVCYTVGVERAASWQLDVHIHLEPVCPRFLGFNPPKRWPFPSKTRVIFQVPGSGSKYIWVVLHPKLHGKYQGFGILFQNKALRW